MWFGLPAEIAVRCGHCGERDWRTPVELKGGRLICFMCGQATLVPPRARIGVDPPPAAAEVARRLAALQPPPPPVGDPAAGVPPGASNDRAGPPRCVLSIVPKAR